MLKPYLHRELLECGVDEVARGVLFGRVYAAAVIWSPGIEVPEKLVIKDSKALSAKKRQVLSDFIKENAIAYSIAYADAEEIDASNILACSIKAMHRAIKGLKMIPEFLLVDGDRFKEYFYGFGKFIMHECIPKGDATYISIACASILAKVEHDKYIKELIDEYPELEVYDLGSNMGYATKKHIMAIEKYGPSPWHRRTFRRVKEFMKDCKWPDEGEYQIETWREEISNKLS